MAEPLSPAGIERRSMEIITRELEERGIAIEEENAAVVRRVIHATADFDFAAALRFTPRAAAKGVEALRAGASIVTDTNMARAGVSGAALARLGGSVICLMAEPEIAEAAQRSGGTRAAAAVERAAERWPDAVLAVGNAPTALLKIAELIERGALRPPLVIGVPVGFVHVVESKQRVMEACLRAGVPAIAAMGRKGGSGVAAAICNALLYSAAGLLDPERR